MARTYRRDARGRFASGGGSGGKGGGKGGASKGASKPKSAGASKAKPAPASKPKAKPAAKRSPATRATSKPAGAKTRATSATRKPPLPPPVPEAILKASKVTSAAMRDRKRETGIANNIRPSPRRHTAAEAAYWDIKNGKGKSRFRSDKKVREEMRRRGFLKDSKDPQGDLIKIARSARRKKGSWY